MTQLIGPRRILDKLTKEEIGTNTVPTLDPVANRKAVERSDSLIALIDEDFFKEGKSLGTKIELVNNKPKVKDIYYKLTGGSFIKYDNKDDVFSKITESLPSWSDYVKEASVEVKK